MKSTVRSRTFINLKFINRVLSCFSYTYVIRKKEHIFHALIVCWWRFTNLGEKSYFLSHDAIENKNAKYSTSFNVSLFFIMIFFWKFTRKGGGGQFFFRHKFFSSKVEKSVFSRKKWIFHLSGAELRIWSMQQKSQLSWIEKCNQNCLNSQWTVT